MKAVVNLAFSAAVGVLVVIGVMSFSVVYQSQLVFKGVQERNIVESGNQIGFVKKGLQQSMIYSTYQSAYETLKYGGYETEGCEPETFNGIPYWVTDDKTCPPTDSAVKDAITSKIQERFGEYLSDFRKKTNIKIPEYEKPEVKFSSVDISLTAKEKIKFVNEIIEISDNANVKGKLQIPFLSLIKSAKAKFGTNFVKESITNADNSMSDFNGKDCKEIEPLICEQEGFSQSTFQPDGNNLLNQHCPGAQLEFENRIKNRIKEKEDANTRMEIVQIETKIDSTCSDGTLNGEEKLCGIKDSGCGAPFVCDGLTLCGEGQECSCGESKITGPRCYQQESKVFCAPDSDAAKACQEPTSACICDEIDSSLPSGFQGSKLVCKQIQDAKCTPWVTHFKKYTGLKCTYNYKATANVLVKVTDKKDKYPVYDKNEDKTDFRNLELQFYVLSKS